MLNSTVTNYTKSIDTPCILKSVKTGCTLVFTYHCALKDEEAHPYALYIHFVSEPSERGIVTRSLVTASLPKAPYYVVGFLIHVFLQVCCLSGLWVAI
jgi:hypothetical protein